MPIRPLWNPARRSEHLVVLVLVAISAGLPGFAAGQNGAHPSSRPEAPEPASAGAAFARAIERARKAAERPAPATESEWGRRRGEILRKIRSGLQFDLFPTRTPLETTRRRRIHRDGFDIEPLVFASRPGFHVTANLYHPDDGAPSDLRRPAIVLPSGDLEGGKAHGSVQALAIALARHGFIVLAFDAAGTGERSAPENGPAESAHLLIAGRHRLSITAWDAMRAADVLRERRDVDENRLGIVAGSGGDAAGLYAALLDDRFEAVASIGLLADWADHITAMRRGNVPDHAPGLAETATLAEVHGVVAPTPLLVVTFAVPPADTRPTPPTLAEALRNIYAIEKAADRVRFVDVEGRPGPGSVEREAIVRHFVRELRSEELTGGLIEKTSDIEPPPATSLLFGDVPAGGIAVRSLALQWFGEVRPDWAADRVNRILDATGGSDMQSRLIPGAERTGGGDGPFGTDTSVRIRLRWTEPGSADPRAVVIAVAGGTDPDPAAGLRSAAESGHFAVVEVMPRGTGLPPAEEEAAAAAGILAGEPLLYQRAKDVRLAVRAARDTWIGAPVLLVARDEGAAMTALLAAVAERGSVARVILRALPPAAADLARRAAGLIPAVFRAPDLATRSDVPLLRHALALDHVLLAPGDDGDFARRVAEVAAGL